MVYEWLLFNLFPSAVMHVALAKFDSDSDGDILQNLVPVRKREEGSATKKCTAAWQKEG